MPVVNLGKRRDLNPAESVGNRRRRRRRRSLIPRLSQLILAAHRSHRDVGAHLPDHRVEDDRARGSLVRNTRE